MSKLSEKQLLVITIAVTLLLTGGLVALILNDRSEIESIDSEIQTVEAQIRACDVEIAKAPQREEDVLVYRAVEDRELDILPTEQMIVQFLNSLSTFLDSSGVRFKQAPESSPTESELAKGIFETRTRLSLAGDAGSLLKFMNMVENDPRLVAIKGYAVTAGQRKRDEQPGPIEHDVNLTLATYFYNPAAGSVKRVHIPNDQRRMQEDKIRAAIDEFVPERPDTYVLRASSSRRDPFVDPRERRVTDDPEAYLAQFKAEEEIVSGFESDQRELAEMVEQENAFLAAGDLFRADRQGRLIDTKLDDVRARLQHALELKKVTIAELQVRLHGVQEGVERLAASRKPRDVRVTEGVARDMLDKIATHFEAGEYSEIATESAGWEGYVRGKEVEEPARPILEKIRQFRRRAKDLAEFKSMKLRIGGTIIDERRPDRSVVLINGKAYLTGERLDEKGELVVVEIGRERVVMRWRDELVPLGVGKK